MKAAMDPEKVLTLVLAGGEGRRLFPLTARRAKPAVSFGGEYRLIDFSLLNCLRSGLSDVFLLAQFQARSIDHHCLEKWPYSRTGMRIQTLLPRGGVLAGGRLGRFAGTADAVYRYLDLIDQVDPDLVLVLAGDHVYRANYRGLIEAHLDREADVTILATDVPAREASSFGVLSTDRSGGIARLVEKPADADRWAAGGKCTISLGVYCFRTGFLRARLHMDASEDSSHDFGKDILPRAIEVGRAFACPLESICPDTVPYWRDAGTIESYYQAQMDLVKNQPPFKLADPLWPSGSIGSLSRPIRTPFLGRSEGFRDAEESIICESAEVDGAILSRCIISPQARIGRGAQLYECVVLPGASVGEGARLRGVIVDEEAAVPPGLEIGCERDRAGIRILWEKCRAGEARGRLEVLKVRPSLDGTAYAPDTDALEIPVHCPETGISGESSPGWSGTEGGGNYGTDEVRAAWGDRSLGAAGQPAV